MKRRNSQVTVTDLFCGAGGSSIGAEKAGALLVMAANHWRLAIDTHNTNFPHADHDCADISQVDPRRYPRTDILIASPECTTHSMARGGKPERTLFDDSPAGIDAIERSRVTMWDVIRFAEHHRYDIVVVENVVEIRRWAPFEAWLRAMVALGYRFRAVYMNSMVAHPTPQSRDRIYVVFWRERNRAPDLRFDVHAWCAVHGDVDGVQSWKKPDRPHGKYRTQYLYRCPTCSGIALPYAFPASTAIDWSLPAPRIGDRERPLAEATMARIRAGLERYFPPFFIKNYGSAEEAKYRPHPITNPLGAITTEDSHALVVDTAYGGSDGHVRPTSEPIASQTARQTQALVVSMRPDGRAFPANAEPLRSVVATCSTQALVVPLRTHGTALRADREPLRSVVAGNVGQALVVPMRQHTRTTRAATEPMPTMLASQTGAALLVPAGGTWNDEARPTDEPMRARTSRETEALVTPPGFLMRNNSGGAEMSTPLDEPTRTLTGKGHQSLVTTPILIDYHGNGRAKPVTEPIGTVDTRDRYGFVEPAIEVEDCGFRMLEPHEIGAAMAFPETYKVLGNKRDRVRQYGNAVTPPVMALLLDRAIASLH